MTFKEALEVADAKSDLVNKLKSHGATLSEVIIVPSDPQEYVQFIELYKQSLNAQQSIIPFIQSDLMIAGIFDKWRIQKEGFILISEI